MFPRRLLAVVLLLCLAAASADAAEVIFIVRHAERETGQGDDSLSVAGRARAEKLAKVLADEGINYIFTSDRKRTIETASPTVAMRQIMAFTIAIGEQKPGGPDPALAQVQATLDAIKDAPDFAHVLIVGHSEHRAAVPGRPLAPRKTSRSATTSSTTCSSSTR